MKIINYIFSRLNVKAVAMLNSFILAVSGVIMIFLEIQGSGNIDIKSPFLTGKVESGFIEISLIFVVLCISVASLFAKKAKQQVNDHRHTGCA